jgi:hypothetical protein
VTDITGSDQFGRILPADVPEVAEPDVTMINGRMALPGEAGSRRAAILADRARCNDVLSGLVRS